jgi:hypothetical protein
MQTRHLTDRANAPTSHLNKRENHRIATLGRNAIIYDYHRTQFLNGGERITKLLPRKKRSWLNRIINLFK